MDQVERFRDLISYVINRVESLDNARTSFMRLGIGMMGLGVAIIVACASKKINFCNSNLQSCVFLIGLIMLILGGILVWLYTTRSSPIYPESDNIVEWYHEPKAQPKIRYPIFETLKNMCKCKEQIEEDKAKERMVLKGQYKTALMKYRGLVEKLNSRTSSVSNNDKNQCEDKQDNLENTENKTDGNLEELFILHMIRTYKRKCLREMVVLLLAGIYSTAILTIFGILFYFNII